MNFVRTSIIEHYGIETKGFSFKGGFISVGILIEYGMKDQDEKFRVAFIRDVLNVALMESKNREQIKQVLEEMQMLVETQNSIKPAIKIDLRNRLIPLLWETKNEIEEREAEIMNLI
jgi:hypothetical protein